MRVTAVFAVMLAAAGGLGLARSDARAQTMSPQAAPPSQTGPVAGSIVSPKANEAEITFWNSVKDSKDPAEFKAYLDAYPQGMFAALAKLRMSALDKPRVTPAPQAIAPQLVPPPAATTPPSTASVLTSPVVVREVFLKLYSLNYQVGVATDRVTPELRVAISTWQRRLNKPATGDLNFEDLARLRNAVAPTVWGALAYSAAGATQTVSRMPSRLAAETMAMAGCRKNAANARCDVVTAALKGCGALAHANGLIGSTRHVGSFAAVRETLVEAGDSAMADCRLKGKVPSACKIRAVFCADGSHAAGATTPAQPAPPKSKSGLQL